ncbi:RNA-binding protein 2-like isoform X1 [Prunus dulcis]|uniref:RNA-binding protein 2-like isoform X1 n=1 Tax=Prunus dulcis TaxID=3755 RepID=UPI001482201C|nr:RNA-binding protein 2-like isoform X1 [Prunus dulcis]
MRGGPWNRQRQLGPSGGVHKRPRSDYDLAAPGLYSGHEMHSYLARDDDFGDPRALKNTKSIGSEYDNYLQNVQMSSHTSGETSTFGGTGLGRAVGGGMVGLPMADQSVMGHPGPIASDLITNGRNMSFANQLPVDAMARPGRETAHLPPDASNTLYVEGLPPDSTKREVAHIFRPFVGYKEVRLVSKESKHVCGWWITKHRGGDPLILCFVDFESPAYAATALSALQGYEMDEHSPDSNYLRLQFSRFPGPRSGPGSRSKR